MATTQTTYTGNGSTTNYSFTFEYLKQADVKVTLDTVATTAFTFANATTLAFTTAPANGVAIRIFRDTVIDTLSSTFFPGSAIKAEDLNENFTQNLYVTQESDAEALIATTTANGAVTTANAATATANGAVTTANAADTKSDAAVATANTASTTASSAVTTANAATATANSASSAAASAVTTANTASTNATAAVNTANTASTNASAAVTTANSAQADATTAVNTANAATTTANNAVTTANSAVTTANTANTNATAAQTAATTAQASATAAQTSATAAQTSATDAQAQATLAADVRNAFTITDSNSDGTFDFVVGDIPIKGNNGVKLPFESVTYAEEGAIRYNNTLDKIELYNGAGQWVTAAGGAAVSSSPPSLPSAGDVWYDHDNGRAYVYYNDGDSNQWVEMNPSWNGYVADNSISSAKIIDGAIVDADVNASAAIAGTKVSPNFGSQNVVTTGNLGVGTASPSGRLTIKDGGYRQGIVLERAASTVDRGFIYIGDGTNSTIADEIYLDASNTAFHFRQGATGTTETVTFKANGKVGIGTTSPNHILTLNTDSGACFAETAAAGYTAGTNSVYYGQDTGGEGYFWNRGNNHLLLGTNNTERMRIDSSGRLLVGTSSTSATCTSVFSGRSDGANDPVLRLEVNSTSPANGTALGGLNFASSGLSSFQAGARIAAVRDGGTWTNGSSHPTYLEFATTANGASSPTERLRIDSAGNVGLGTNSPGNYLASAHQLVISDSASTGLTIATPTSSSGTIAFADGTGAADNARGLIRYGHSDNSLQFSTNAAERMRIDSSGNVGIGVTPNTHNTGKALEIGAEGNVLWGEGAGNIHLLSNAYYNGGYKYATSAPAGRYNIYQNTHTWARASSGTADAAATFTESMRIDSSGRLLVGTSSDFGSGSTADKLQVATSAGGHLLTGRSDTTVTTNEAMGLWRGYSYGGGVWEETARISMQADDAHASGDKPGRLVFSTTADGASSPTERMKIANNGTSFFQSNENVIGAMSATAAGTAVRLYYGAYSAANFAGTVCYTVWTNGNVVNANNSYGSLSDAKLKENIVDASSQWDDLKAIQVRNYNFIEGQTHTQIGVVAQEVELVSPGLVSESPDRDDDGNDLGTVTKSVNYSVLYMKAVKALQEAMERIETLETKVTALEGA